MTNFVKIQHKQYELFLLPKILNSNFFFICFLNEQEKMDFYLFKQFCVTHNIKLQIFKNNIIKKALKNTQWSILNQNIFGPIVIGYNKTPITYGKSDLEQIFLMLLQNKSIGFLSGYFAPMLLNSSLLRDLISYNKILLKNLNFLNSLKFQIAKTLLFVPFKK
jgi:hypothetical protein